MYINNQQKKEITYVYIDGFNLYYGALNKNKKPGLKWLDIQSWLNKVLLYNDIRKIKFFTSRISGKYDSTKPDRQDVYFRALRTLPFVEIIEGFFLTKKQRICVTKDIDLFANIPEEKGTDVNLAIHVLNDARKNKFQTAIIVSNDSDFAEVVKVVTKELKMKVGILNPFPTFNKQLTKYATFKLPIRETAILKSQFPNTLSDSTGMFTKPVGW